MALNDKQKMERAEYLERNLTVTECSRRESYVFISYASDDWETVFKEAVVPLQRQYGLRVFADKAFDKVNDKWIVPMLRNIRGADLMIAFVSQKYIESYACFLELLTAINSKKQVIFVALENCLNIGASDDQPAIERGVKIELLNQGANITTITNNTSNDIMRAMKSAFTSISTFIEQDSLSKYDISDAFINFFRDASINTKTINDLNALQSTIRSVSKNVFAFTGYEQPVFFNNEQQETNVIPHDVPVPQEDQTAYTYVNRSDTVPYSGIRAAAEYPAAVQNKEKTKRTIIISVLSFLVVLLAILLIVSLSHKTAKNDIPASAEAETTGSLTEKGSIKNDDGSHYEGDLINDIPNGKGIMTYASGEIYTGEWKDGKRNGKGTMTYAEGDVYKGEWKDGKRNGQGTYTWADGDIYEGEFKDGLSDGYGTITYTNGNVYEGEWKDDTKSGQGIYTWANGDVYEGEFKDGSYNGQGTYTWADGTVYTGEWKDDEKCGHGTMTYTYGDVYEGEWKDDAKNGQGTMTYANGDVYEGEWKADTFYGYGKYIYASGDIMEGEFIDVYVNGTYSGKDAQGNSYIYTGELSEGFPNGYGTCTFENGDVWSGQWKDGEFIS